MEHGLSSLLFPSFLPTLQGVVVGFGDMARDCPTHWAPFELSFGRDNHPTSIQNPLRTPRLPGMELYLMNESFFLPWGPTPFLPRPSSGTHCLFPSIPPPFSIKCLKHFPPNFYLRSTPGVLEGHQVECYWWFKVALSIEEPRGQAHEGTLWPGATQWVSFICEWTAYHMLGNVTSQVW